MFSSLTEISGTELNILTNKPIQKKSRAEVFCKKGVPKNFVKLTGKNLCRSLFFSQALGLQRYLKRDFVTGVFLSILRNFYKHLFSDGCFFQFESHWIHRRCYANEFLK